VLQGCCFLDSGGRQILLPLSRCGGAPAISGGHGGGQIVGGPRGPGGTDCVELGVERKGVVCIEGSTFRVQFSVGVYLLWGD
jgi:hypothetical protein